MPKKKPRPAQPVVTPEDAPASGVPIAGIAASAGGLDAFKRFLGATPPDSGVAFVLIPHLDPNHESLMVELLAKQTRMPVLEARDGTKVEPNTVYIIPPNKYLAIGDGKLRLSKPPEPRGLQLAIDFFLRSLAEDRRERAIGIVLSGTGSHGALGLQAIKAAGGMTMAQAPDTAEYDRMPRSAIATGIVDFVLPPEQMPQALVEYARHAFVADGGESAPEVEAASDRLNRVLALLRARTKYDFSSYRKNMLMRRVQRRMGLKHVDGFDEYFDLLRTDADELNNLFRDLLIGVTVFFRDPEAYEILEQRVIPELIERTPADRPIRVWVSGCATGEEAYSIAMLLIEQLSALQRPLNLQIFASDIHKEALEIARQGVYPESVAADIAPARLQRFFTHVDHDYHVNKQLRETVLFAVQNLLTDAPFSRLDLISCRNLLIYLEPETQQKVISLFHYALNEDGYMFLGTSETVGRQVELFEPISRKWRVFRRIGLARHDLVRFPISPAERRRHAPVEPALQQTMDLAELTQRQLLEEFAPAAVLITRQYEILYFQGALGDYLEPPRGEPTRDLLAMARDGLRIKLRAVCHKALRDNEIVTDDTAGVTRNGGWHPCTITAKPVVHPKGVEGLLLVTFRPRHDATRTGPGGDEAVAPALEESALVRHLEEELKATRQDLQSTIEELESSNEELKASNEEVMSMNEELQSTNEELETSKEELQSLNEELSTVNNQLQDKLEELDKTHNDLTNLLNSTDIATVFLDPEMRIRQFTPATSRLLGLIAGDVGRPISTFATVFTGADVLEDSRQVLDTLVPLERIFATDHQRHYLRRILPYRTADHRIGGVVVTFVDVTGQVEAEVQSQQLERLRRIVEHLPAGAVFVHGDRLVMNRSAEEITGYAREELATMQRWFDSLYAGRADEMRRRYEAMREGERTGPVPIRRKDGTERSVELAGYRMDEQEIWLMYDVTPLLQAEQDLRRSEERLRATLNTASDAIITIDLRGVIVAANPATFRLFGYLEEELIGQNVRILMPAPYREEHDSYISRYLETGKARIIGIGREVVGRRKDGSTFPIDLAVSRILGFGLFTGMIRDITDRKELQRQVLDIAAQEGQRIGHELHEGLQQEVTALELFAGTLRDALDQASGRGLDGGDLKGLQATADRLSKGLAATHEHVRQLARGILPVSIEAGQLRTALAELAASINVRGIRCRLDAPEVLDVPGKTTATHLYRIAQEAVNNALRHSGGNEIRLALTKRDDQIVLEVSDNGSGLDLSASRPAGVTARGAGVRAMHYRASLMGATLHIGRGPSGGTVVRCTLSARRLR